MEPSMLKLKQPSNMLIEAAQLIYVGKRKQKCYHRVTRHKRSGRYESYIPDKHYVHHDGTQKAKHGTYDDEKDAARAQDLASVKLLGDKSVLNFPIHRRRLLKPMIVLYDCAALQYVGPHAVTNFDRRRYVNLIHQDPKMPLPNEMLQISIMPLSQRQHSARSYMEPTNFTSQDLQPQTNLQLPLDQQRQTLLQQILVPQQQMSFNLPQPLFASQEFLSVECRPLISQLDAINIFDEITTASDIGDLSRNFQSLYGFDHQFNHRLVPEVSQMDATNHFYRINTISDIEDLSLNFQSLSGFNHQLHHSIVPEVSHMDTTNLFDGINTSSDIADVAWNFQSRSGFDHQLDHRLVPETIYVNQAEHEELYGNE